MYLVSPTGEEKEKLSMKRRKKKNKEEMEITRWYRPPDILLVVLYCYVATSLNLLGRLARCSCVARNIKMHLYE